MGMSLVSCFFSETQCRFDRIIGMSLVCSFWPWHASSHLIFYSLLYSNHKRNAYTQRNQYKDRKIANANRGMFLFHTSNRCPVSNHKAADVGLPGTSNFSNAIARPIGWCCHYFSLFCRAP